MKYTQAGAQKMFPKVLFEGGYFYIGAGAYIREGADIGEGADIITICSKYNGNIIPMLDKMLIRIGCEKHTAEEWGRHGDKLAAGHNEDDWWAETGKRMLSYLIDEAKLYESKYPVEEKQ